MKVGVLAVQGDFEAHGRMLSRLGADPVYVRTPEQLEGLDALILPGGGDIGPAHYGGVRHEANYGISAERDRFELGLALAALARGLPILSICRGMQLLNVALGGDLVSHIPDHFGDTVAIPRRAKWSAFPAAWLGSPVIQAPPWTTTTAGAGPSTLRGR